MATGMTGKDPRTQSSGPRISTTATRAPSGRGMSGTDPRAPNMANVMNGVFARIQAGKSPQEVQKEIAARYGSSFAKQATQAYMKDPRRGQVKPITTPGGPDKPNPYTDPNAPVNFDNVSGATNREVFDDINAIGNRADFQAQGLPDLNYDYAATRQKAEGAVMDSFNRQMEPRFKKEEQDFRQMMAERGVPEGSEQFTREYGNMKQAQNSAYGDAQNQAFLTGQSEQNLGYNQALAGRDQGFNQQLATYQQPLQNLQAFSPFYQQGANIYQQQQGFGHDTNLANLGYRHNIGLGAQGQKFKLEQMAKQFGYDKQLQSMIPRGHGGGGGSPNYSGLDNMITAAILGGGGAPQQGYAGGFAGGVNQGVGLGLASALR